MVAGFKRKAVEGGAEETDMEALERQTRKIQVRQGFLDSLSMRSHCVAGPLSGMA